MLYLLSFFLKRITLIAVFFYSLWLINWLSDTENINKKGSNFKKPLLFAENNFFCEELS